MSVLVNYVTLLRIVRFDVLRLRAVLGYKMAQLVKMYVMKTLLRIHGTIDAPAWHTLMQMLHVEHALCHATYVIIVTGTYH